MLQVVGLGAGGHAKVVVDILQQAGNVEIVGMLMPDKKHIGKTVLGVPVLGDDSLLGDLYTQGIRHAFLGVGSVDVPNLRYRLYKMLVKGGFRMVKAVHPKSTIAGSASMGNGATVMAGAVIGPCARLGVNVIVNSSAVVEHDCEIGDHVHISPGASLAGGVHVGERTHIGLGACVIQNVHIGNGSTVGAGAVVLNGVEDNVVVVGVPARILRVEDA